MSSSWQVLALDIPFELLAELGNSGFTPTFTFLPEFKFYCI